MIRPVRIFPAVIEDLDAQAIFLAGRSEGLGDRFLDAATATFQDIANTPGLGERHPSRSKKLAGVRLRRIDGFENHLVCYRPSETEIEIVRVVHGAQGLDHIL